MTRSAELLLLQAGDTRLTLDPQRGGAVRAFTWRDKDIFRPTAAHAGDDPLDTACFAMVPFANRVANGRFIFAGRAVRLAPNCPAEPHPLHGKGWRVSWLVAAASRSQAVIRFEGGADEWPWQYRSEQCFRVLENGLSVELSVENLGRTPMPAMLGLHPYYPDAPGAVLEARLPRVWLTDEGALPVQEARTPSAWGFEPPRVIAAVPLDHSFSGWNGSALLRWPGRSLRMRARGCGSLHVYVPPGNDFFCIEPQTAAAGALGRDQQEATVIAPGERCAIRVDFAVRES